MGLRPPCGSPWVLFQPAQASQLAFPSPPPQGLLYQQISASL